MNSKVNFLYDFLSSNREYSKDFQRKGFISLFPEKLSSSDKIISLIYHIVNTQSQPKIDKLADFYKDLIKNQKSLKSFESFVNHINTKNQTPIYLNLFEGMKNQLGWGNKTAALFTKCIFQLHNESFPTEFKVWDDVPRLVKDDKLFLPVDRVITCIFEKLNFLERVNFKSINKFLHDEYSNDQIEIWDDLWFWGFITQKGSGKDRIHTWNENKYWMLKDSDKNPNTIEKIKEKSLCFLEILNSSSL